MPDDYADVCDTRLWMMDLEGDCRRVIEAMPPERRARFETVRIVSWETVYGPDSEEWDDEWRAFVKEQAERPVVYLVTTWRMAVPLPSGRPNERIAQTFYWQCPVPEAMLKDADRTDDVADIFSGMAERGRDYLIESLQGEPM